MQNQTSFELIKGSFNAADAKDLLLNLLHQKINFHQMKSFGQEERTGKKDLHSEERIVELKKNRQELIAFLAEADKERLTLLIDSVVVIHAKPSL